MVLDSMAQLPFANDGSFMAQFMAQQAAAAAASVGIGQIGGSATSGGECC